MTEMPDWFSHRHAPDALTNVPIVYEFAPGQEDRTPIEMGNDEPLPMALRRISRGQLDRAISGLTDPDADFDIVVHEARKSLKRVRALLRLVRDEIGYENYRNENVVLRDIGRRLAPARDAFVLMTTLDSIVEHHGKVMAPDAFGGLRSWLLERHLELRQGLIDDREQMITIVFTLKASWARISGTTVMTKLDGSPYIRDDFAAVEGGLRRVYRRGRRGLRAVLESESAETLHEWRKRVKYLRYQLETLTPIAPELLSGRAHLLDDLGEILGTDHDLAVLAELVAEEHQACPDPTTRSLLELMIDEMRRDLGLKAIDMGTFLYQEPPKVFVERIGRQWERARPAR